MDTSLSLCSNCLFLPSCNLRNGRSVVFECEEYQLLSADGIELNYNYSEECLPLNKMGDCEPAGICGNCDNLPQCHWRCNSNALFHCEHYQ